MKIKTNMVLFLMLFGIFNLANAQNKVNSVEAKNYAGKEVIIKGKVEQVKKLAKVTYLNIDGMYPGNLLTVVIFTKDTAIFTKDYKSFDNFCTQIEGKEVTVSGKVELYKEKAQIVVNKAEQLKEDGAEGEEK